MDEPFQFLALPFPRVAAGNWLMRSGLGREGIGARLSCCHKAF